jgi:hypothetical protein
LLEASAQRADTSVHHLIALLERLEQKDSPRNLEEFVRIRRKYLQENVAGLDARRTRSSQRTMF